MILSSEPAVVVQRFRQMDFMTRATKGRVAMQWFEQTRFVKCGCALQGFVVQPSKNRSVGTCKGVISQRLNLEACVSTGCCHRGSRMTGEASNAEVGLFMRQVEGLLVECASQ